MVFRKKPRIDELEEGPTLEEVEATVSAASTANVSDPLWMTGTNAPSQVEYSIPSVFTSRPLPDRDELIREWSFDLLKTIMATRNMKVNQPLVDEVVAGATYLADKLGIH